MVRRICGNFALDRVTFGTAISRKFRWVDQSTGNEQFNHSRHVSSTCVKCQKLIAHNNAIRFPPDALGRTNHAIWVVIGAVYNCSFLPSKASRPIHGINALSLVWRERGTLRWAHAKSVGSFGRGAWTGKKGKKPLHYYLFSKCKYQEIDI